VRLYKFTLVNRQIGIKTAEIAVLFSALLHLINDWDMLEDITYWDDHCDLVNRFIIKFILTTQVILSTMAI